MKLVGKELVQTKVQLAVKEVQLEVFMQGKWSDAENRTQQKQQQ